MNSESDYIDLLSERQKRTKLYEDWLKLRDLAKRNADGKLPEGFDEMFAPPNGCVPDAASSVVTRYIES